MDAGVSLTKDYLLKLLVIFSLVVSQVGSEGQPSYNVLDTAFSGHSYSLKFAQHERSRRDVAPDNSDVTTAAESLTADDGTAVPQGADTVTVSSTLPSSTTSTTTTSTVPSTSMTSSSTVGQSSSTSATTTVSTASTAGLPSTTPSYTETKDNHTYYTSSIVYGLVSELLWLDLDKMDSDLVHHQTLSDSHRTAATVQLSFDFPFYGHTIDQVTIATGGFLYMSDFLHQWLTATQYIAPLMANFDTRLGESSTIKYTDNGTVFVVQWEDVYLKDRPESGSFTFQVLLLKEGPVIFNYKTLSLPVENISTHAHPVKIGLSDAYYMDREVGDDVRRRTIYEYHRVKITKNTITNNTSVIINPLPTCNLETSCGACLATQINFECQWCSSVGRCSDGLDRHRQEWYQMQCPINVVEKDGSCPHAQEHNTDANAERPIIEPEHTNIDAKSSAQEHNTEDNAQEKTLDVTTAQPSPLMLPHDPMLNASLPAFTWNHMHALNVGSIFAIIVVLLIIGLLVIWFVYAYKNPQSRSGMWLIENRPSNLKAKLSKVHFWKSQNASGEKYEVTMQPDGDTAC